MVRETQTQLARTTATELVEETQTQLARAVTTELVKEMQTTKLVRATAN